MAHKDKIKWNKKYQETPKLLEDREAGEKLQEVLTKLLHGMQGKKALDVACGAGKNAIYLAQQGFNVDAMDISEVALKSLQSKHIEHITTHLVDLENFTPQENHYDMIVQTNYLDRALIPKLLKALKKEGFLFIETYMFHEENEKPPSNPDFLLQEKELKSFVCDDFKIIDYDEFFNPEYELYKMRKQSILIQKL